MADRRPMGALEFEVLDCLWSSGVPLTPGEVLERLDSGLAYTTIMPILRRLWEKGLVDRSRNGRAYAYRTKVTEADLMAERMKETLRRANDPRAALARFAQRLNKREAAALRAALEVEQGKT